MKGNYNAIALVTITLFTSEVSQGDPEATGKVAANKGFVAKYANAGCTYPCVSKL